MGIPIKEFKKVPNLVTLVRFACIPALLYFAFMRMQIPFLVAFGIAGLSDFLDGFLARMLKQESAFGANLDGMADEAIMGLTVVFLYLFRPDTLLRYWPWIAVSVALMITQEALILLKHHNKMRLHLWSLKAVSAIVYVAAFAFVLTGYDPIILALIICHYVAMSEEILVLATRNRISPDIRTIFQREK